MGDKCTCEGCGKTFVMGINGIVRPYKTSEWFKAKVNNYTKEYVELCDACAGVLRDHDNNAWNHGENYLNFANGLRVPRWFAMEHSIDDYLDYAIEELEKRLTNRFGVKTVFYPRRDSEKYGVEFPEADELPEFTQEELKEMQSIIQEYFWGFEFVDGVIYE